MDTAVRYIKKRLRMNLGSCVLKRKQIGRVFAGCVISSCVREPVEVALVLEF
jgi:hypothetical protein